MPRSPVPEIIESSTGLTSEDEETIRQFLQRLQEEYELDESTLDEVIEIHERLMFSPNETDVDDEELQPVHGLAEELSNKVDSPATVEDEPIQETMEPSDANSNQETAPEAPSPSVANSNGDIQPDSQISRFSRGLVSDATPSYDTILGVSGSWRTTSGDIQFRHPATIAVLFTVVAGIVSALFYNPFDVPAYARISLQLLDGQNIYPTAVYPPSLYLIGALILGGLETIPLVAIESDGLLAIGTFGVISTVTLAGIYYLGAGAVPGRLRRKWLAAVILNPFALFVGIFHGQMTLFVVLGVAGAIYAISTKNWRIGGALLAVSASVKIYPAAIALIFFMTNVRHSREILEGAAPIVFINLLGIAAFYPESMSIFSSPGAIRPVNLLFIITDGSISQSLAESVFLGLLLLATLAGVLLPIRKELKLLFPIIPAVTVYPLLIEYRLLALALSMIVVGFAIEERAGSAGRATIVSGLAISILGTISMLLGSYQGWLEDAHWVTPTLFSWPPVPAGADPSVFTQYRQWTVLLVVGVTVIWFVSLAYLRSAIYSEQDSIGAIIQNIRTRDIFENL